MFINRPGSYDQFGKRALSDDDLRRIAPSIFAVEAHESRSERFAVIPTSGIVTGMRAEGFVPVSAKQARTRDVTKREYTKHMIRFRHVSDDTSVTTRKVGDTFREVVLVNAQDGTSAYKLYEGLLRFACLNGLIVWDGVSSGISVPHKGNVRDAVIEGSFTVLESSLRALDAADHWSGITLSREAQQAFAESAHTVRFADSDGNVNTPIRPAQLLHMRRHADASDDLWTVFNRVQENAIRGGLSGVARDPVTGRRGRRTTTKEVNGIDGDVRLNKALWALGARMAGILGNASV